MNDTQTQLAGWIIDETTLIRKALIEAVTERVICDADTRQATITALAGQTIADLLEARVGELTGELVLRPRRPGHPAALMGRDRNGIPVRRRGDGAASQTRCALNEQAWISA